MDIKKSPDEFRSDKGMAELIAEGHAAVIDLSNIRSADSDINYIASHGHEAASELVARLEKIDALPKPPNMGTLMVASFIHGLYGNVYAGYAMGADADEKTNAIRTEALRLVAVGDTLGAMQLLLPNVAKKYAPPLTQGSAPIRVQFKESYGDIVGPFDWLILENCSGQPIDDCTVVVELTGAAGEIKTNVHFVPKWPAQSSVYARYDGGLEVVGRVVGRSTARDVQKLAVTAYSPTLSIAVDYTYQGLKKGEDFEERCKKLVVRGRYRPYAGGMFWDDERAAVLTLDGVSVLPKCKLTVAFVRGSEAKSWFWDLDSWKKGEEKTFATPNSLLKKSA